MIGSIQKTESIFTVKETVLFALFTALIAIGAFIRVPVPVCPFTLQLLFTMLAGLILGSKRGALSVALYVGLGLLGIPVFTSGGGPSYIFQPTFGYLIGFIAGAYVTGYMAERARSRSFGRILLANLTGLMIVYLFGMVYVYIINTYYLGTPIGIWPIVLYCFILAVPGDICLCILAAGLSRKLLRVSGQPLA
ncbi:MAG: biotin transporter BioY [Dialister sp.]|nr:biotin transporter BioY [Dialister sp.]